MLAAKKAESGLQAFVRQYQDLMQVILVGAAIVNQVVTGETGTTIVLVGLTIFNAVLGLRQEAKAQASLAALEKKLKDIARVRRDGAPVEIDAAELVPGDVVLFEALKDVASIGGEDVGLGDRLCLASPLLVPMRAILVPGVRCRLGRSQCSLDLLVRDRCG